MSIIFSIVLISSPCSIILYVLFLHLVSVNVLVGLVQLFFSLKTYIAILDLPKCVNMLEHFETIFCTLGIGRPAFGFTAKLRVWPKQGKYGLNCITNSSITLDDSARARGSSSGSFWSVVPHRHQTISQLQSAGYALKVIKAVPTQTRHKKIEFKEISQVHVDLEEDTASVEYVLRAVRNRWGPSYIIVTSDGLPIEECSSTKGIISF